jgi:hypothetical protein
LAVKADLKHLQFIAKLLSLIFTGADESL